VLLLYDVIASLCSGLPSAKKGVRKANGYNRARTTSVTYVTGCNYVLNADGSIVLTLWTTVQ